ncbi:MAG: AtpZ/AtpI family protein [Alphaproteobacteria bacterium]|nr:AtpZ/AtpI family protein [Alphaproteobacteria bacterium]
MARSPRSRGSGEEAEGKGVTGDLAARIARARQERAAQEADTSRRHGDMTGMGRALRFAAEFMAAIIIGALIGYTIDFALGTTPWAMIGMLMVGFAAGVLNVVRAAAEANAAAAVKGPAPRAVPDEEDDD